MSEPNDTSLSKFMAGNLVDMHAFVKCRGEITEDEWPELVRQAIGHERRCSWIGLIVSVSVLVSCPWMALFELSRNPSSHFVSFYWVGAVASLIFSSVSFMELCKSYLSPDLLIVEKMADIIGRSGVK